MKRVRVQFSFSDDLYDFGFLKRVYSYKHMALNICIDYGLLQQLDVDSFLIYLSCKQDLSCYNLRIGIIQQLENGSSYRRSEEYRRSLFLFGAEGGANGSIGFNEATAD